MLSVIIPTYNEERYLEETLRSVIAQTPKPEIIVVDSKSTDNTVHIARMYADRVLITARGVSKARNKGASVASGNIVVFLDADTKLHSNTIRVIENAFQKDVIGVCGNVRSDGPLHARILYKLTSAVAFGSSLIHVPLFYGMCMAWKKDVFDASGGFDENTLVGEDMKLTLALHNKGRCIWVRDARATTSSRRLRGRLFWVSSYMHLKNFFKLVFLKQTDDIYPPVR